MTPEIGEVSSNATSNLLPRPLLMIGQAATKPVALLKALGERTSAGRLLSISRPDCGIKSNQMRSPRSGAEERRFTKPLDP